MKGTKLDPNPCWKTEPRSHSGSPADPHLWVFTSVCLRALSSKAAGTLREKAENNNNLRKKKRESTRQHNRFPHNGFWVWEIRNNNDARSAQRPDKLLICVENALRFERLCHQSIREPNCDRFCLAVIRRASKSSNRTLIFLAAPAWISRVVVSHVLHSVGIKKE